MGVARQARIILHPGHTRKAPPGLVRRRDRRRFQARARNTIARCYITARQSADRRKRTLHAISGDRGQDDRFGDVLVALDFDESYDDLAVGVPNEDAGNIADAGWVEVLYGTADGIRLTGK